MTQSKFVRIVLFAGIAIPCFATGLINFVADPYDVWGIRIESLNKHKPVVRDYHRIGKVFQIRRANQSAVAVGSSRVFGGIDPDDTAWPDEGLYNLGLYGPSIAEQLAYVEYYDSIVPIRTLVYGADFAFFNGARPPDSNNEVALEAIESGLGL